MVDFWRARHMLDKAVIWSLVRDILICRIVYTKYAWQIRVSRCVSINRASKDEIIISLACGSLHISQLLAAWKVGCLSYNWRTLRHLARHQYVCVCPKQTWQEWEGEQCMCVWMRVPLELSISRERERERMLPKTHPVDSEFRYSKLYICTTWLSSCFPKFFFFHFLGIFFSNCTFRCNRMLILWRSEGSASLYDIQSTAVEMQKISLRIGKEREGTKKIFKWESVSFVFGALAG